MCKNTEVTEEREMVMYTNGKKYTVPEELTIMGAMEYAVIS
jgi:hypothetical protein